MVTKIITDEKKKEKSLEKLLSEAFEHRVCKGQE